MPSLTFASQIMGKPGTGSQPNTDTSRVEELLGAMRDTAGDAPVPPPKPSVARMITGSIADALRARATVLAGGIPGEGTFSQELRQQQEEYRKAREKYDQDIASLNKEIAEFRLQMAAADRDRELNEAVAGRKSRLEDELTRSREEEDDFRDAAIATQKWKADKLLTLSVTAGKLRAQGIPVPDIPTNPSAMTTQNIIEASLLLNALVTGTTMSMSDEARMREQIEAVQKIFPNMIPTGVNYSGKEGRPNVVMRADPLSTLTDSDRRDAESAGVDLYDANNEPRTPQDIHRDITAFKKEQIRLKDEERRARLDKIIKGGDKFKGNPTVRMKIVEQLDMISNTSKLLNILNAMEGGPGGPLVGKYIPSKWRYEAVSAFRGDREADFNREAEILMTAISNWRLKVDSGAAVTRTEEIRFIPVLPQIDDWKDFQIEKTRNLMEWAQTTLDNTKKAFGLTDEDIGLIEREEANRGRVQSQQMEGDVNLLGGR